MTEYACRVKRDAYISRASSTAWRASMSEIRAYAEGVGTLNVGKRGRWTVRHTVTSLPSRGTPRSALRPSFHRRVSETRPIRSVLGSTES